MKNWKKLNVLGIVIIFVMAFGFIGCDPDKKDNGNNDPICECPNGTVHPLGFPCTCPVAGTSACNCTEEAEQPEFRETTIIFNFINTRMGNAICSAKIQGTLLNSEWSGVPESLKSTIDEAYSTGNTVAKSVFEDTFNAIYNAIITVEKTTEYSIFKVTGVFTLSLNIDNIDKLLDQSVLGGGVNIVKAVRAMDSNNLIME